LFGNCHQKLRFAFFFFFPAQRDFFDKNNSIFPLSVVAAPRPPLGVQSLGVSFFDEFFPPSSDFLTFLSGP